MVFDDEPSIGTPSPEKSMLSRCDLNLSPFDLKIKSVHLFSNYIEFVNFRSYKRTHERTHGQPENRIPSATVPEA